MAACGKPGFGAASVGSHSPSRGTSRWLEPASPGTDGAPGVRVGPGKTSAGRRGFVRATGPGVELIGREERAEREALRGAALTIGYLMGRIVHSHTGKRSDR